MTRKLIKPDLNEIKKYQKKDSKKKPPPPYKTHAENYYYIKQMNNHTSMIVEMVNGDILTGRIEWYDEKCIKVRRDDNSNFIVFKHFIKYIYKSPEAEAQEKRERAEKEASEKLAAEAAHLAQEAQEKKEKKEKKERIEELKAAAKDEEKIAAQEEGD